jgi:ketosteroid isomerase-like protein
MRLSKENVTSVRRLGLAVLIAGFGTIAAADLATTPPVEDPAHEALRALKRDVEAAFNKAGRSHRLEDFQGVLDHVEPNIVLAAMNGDLVVGKDKVVTYFNEKMSGSGTVRSIEHTFEPTGLTVLYGGSTGVAYGTSKGKYELTGGTRFEVDTLWTSTLIKDGDQWKIASFQFGPNIFDNPLLNRALRSLYWGAGLAGAIGVALGFVVGRASGRPKAA